jgi:xanthine dehydrogenase YagT iron-sulfur-binding subunit
MDESADLRDPTRRRLFGAAAGLTGAAALPSGASQAAVMEPGQSGAVDMTLSVNGQDHRLRADVRTSLLDALREHLHLTGSKKGCDQGQCGACTVHLDGERVLSCLTLAVAAQGRAVTTIEGLAPAGGGLHPTDADIREYMSGNLCRCAAYPRIVEAIRAARGKMPGPPHGGRG